MTGFVRKHKKFLPYVYIFVGTLSLAVGLQCVYDPIGLVIGGFTGLSIIIKNLTESVIEGGIPLWLANIILNVPVFIVAYFQMGRKFIGRTLFGTVMLSIWLYIIPPVDMAQGDYLLAAIFGAVFSGVGSGLVFLARATTGGTDMVAALIQKKMRHYSVVRIMQIIDGMVILLGLYVFGLHATLYAIVSIYILAKISDAILEGFKYSKAAYIITNEYEEVARRLMEELERGVTGLEAKGMYTGQKKCVLYCVVSKKEIVAVKELVMDVDPDAFVIVSEVHEVLGEGFLEYKSSF